MRGSRPQTERRQVRLPTTPRATASLCLSRTVCYSLGFAFRTSMAVCTDDHSVCGCRAVCYRTTAELRVRRGLTSVAGDGSCCRGVGLVFLTGYRSRAWAGLPRVGDARRTRRARAGPRGGTANARALAFGILREALEHRQQLLHVHRFDQVVIEIFLSHAVCVGRPRIAAQRDQPDPL